MSAIADAHKLTEAQLDEALLLFDRNQHQEYWKLMAGYEVGTLPYSGYVFAAVVPFLHGKGIVLPKDGGPKSLTSSHRRQLGVVALGNARDYDNVSNGIKQLQVTDDELRRFYADLYAHDWEEASAAMREGFIFVQRGIRALNSDDELLMFSII